MSIDEEDFWLPSKSEFATYLQIAKHVRKAMKEQAVNKCL